MLETEQSPHDYSMKMCIKLPKYSNPKAEVYSRRGARVFHSYEVRRRGLHRGRNQEADCREARAQSRRKSNADHAAAVTIHAAGREAQNHKAAYRHLGESEVYRELRA